MERTLFGPLPREYCLYYYALSVLFAFLTGVACLGTILLHMQGRVRHGSMAAGAIPTLFLAYFTNRLLYTMCART